jgi:hypothetical protein
MAKAGYLVIDPDGTTYVIPARAEIGLERLRRPVCQRCGGPLPEYSGNGRPARYCRAACRKAAYRARATKKASGPRSEWWTDEELSARLDVLSTDEKVELLRRLLVDDPEMRALLAVG